MKAIRLDRNGGPDVLDLRDVPTPAPGPGELLVRQTSIGVNFIDTYHRTGLYPIRLPSGLGLEGAGVVEQAGEGAEAFAPGARVGYCTAPMGAYAEFHIVPANRVVRLPAGVDDDIAAASLLKGMTARYLLKKTFPVQPGDAVVIHAAAGGVGQIAVQWAAHLGAVVIAVAGGPEKCALARSLGAHHTIDSKAGNIAARVREITDGEGAAVVYDSVGKDTFEASLDSLRPLGMFVSFGNASGPAPAVNPAVLSAKGSLFFTRPGLFHYTRTPELLQETGDDLFDAIARGIVKVAAPRGYPLAQAAQAHIDLEARATTGSLVLRP